MYSLPSCSPSQFYGNQSKDPSVATTQCPTSVLPSCRSRKLSREEETPVQRLSLPPPADLKLAAVCILANGQLHMADEDSAGSKASSPTEQKNQIDFQFLNFSHPSEAKASRARRTVRSHVTRQQHQREHAAAAARRAKSVPQPEGEMEDIPGPRAHAATFPPNRPTLELPSQAGPAPALSDASSQSPSPTGSPMDRQEQRLDPFEVYPEEWHPYLQGIMVSYLYAEMFGRN